jgi:hypothetical protein
MLALPGHTSVRRVFPDTAGRLAFRWGLPGFHARLSLLPTFAACWPVCVHPSYTSWSNGYPAQCRVVDSIVHRHEVESPLPQGSSLLLELCCLEPSSLNRPHPPHSWAHRDFTARRLIRDVFAVRERRGDPRVVPSFRCTLLPVMPPSPTPGSSDIHKFQIGCRHWPSPNVDRLGTPKTPANPFHAGGRISWLIRFAHCCGLPGCLPPLNGSDRITPTIGDFYFLGFKRVGHPSRFQI